jgi:predicted CoA-binding protein
MRQILEEARVIAIVGESNDHYYTSYQVAQYLKDMGYKVYPVNPTIAEVDGDKSYPTLSEVPEAIDIVDVFRAPEYLPEITDEAIALQAKVIWTQLGVVSLDEVPEHQALAAGLKVVSNKCIRTEHERLGIPSKSPEKWGLKLNRLHRPKFDRGQKQPELRPKRFSKSG